MEYNQIKKEKMMVQLLMDGATAFDPVAAELEKIQLRARIENNRTDRISAYRQNTITKVQENMADLSLVVYEAGYDVYKGITGKSADALSQKLNRLSSDEVNGFDQAALSVKSL